MRYKSKRNFDASISTLDILQKHKKNTAIADKPRDAFKGQLRSPNMVPLHRLGMFSY